MEQIYQAEASVIGCILREPKSIDRFINTITPDDFYFSDIRETYSVILEMLSKGEAIDALTVLNKLGDTAETKTRLFEYAQAVGFVSSADMYARIVSGSHKARRLNEIAREILDAGATFDTAETIAETAMSGMYELAVSNKNHRLSSAKDGVLEMYSELGKKDSRIRIDTGFWRIDNKLKGMWGGNLIVLAARPKVGKTAFALNIAANAAKKGTKVAFYSLEMQKSEMIERMVAAAAHIPLDKLIDRCFTDERRPERVRDEEWKAIASGAGYVSQLPIFINDNPTISINNIRAECRMIKNLGLIVVDYIQLIKPVKKGNNRNEDIGGITRDLKILAAELNVPVLALSQLNRNSDESSKPSASELRDSGEIEQNANKVMLMWCIEKNFDENDTVTSKVVGVDVALNRAGGTGITKLHFDGSFMKFIELEERYEAPKRKKAAVPEY